MSEKITDSKKLKAGIKYAMIPNRIEKLWWQAQREVNLLHPNISYGDFCKETKELWEQLGKDKGMDVYDNKYQNEPTEWIPIKKEEVD
tara:strand:+ start:754 stop:1017 length:264 start_codon:yes stop_codon:yes gene_type:complete